VPSKVFGWLPGTEIASVSIIQENTPSALLPETMEIKPTPFIKFRLSKKKSKKKSWMKCPLYLQTEHGKYMLLVPRNVKITLKFTQVNMKLVRNVRMTVPEEVTGWRAKYQIVAIVRKIHIVTPLVRI
jgi:hypothetical protein